MTVHSTARRKLLGWNATSTLCLRFKFPSGIKNKMSFGHRAVVGKSYGATFTDHRCFCVHMMIVLLVESTCFC